MTRLLILVEGQTEEAFVKRTLAPYLAKQGLYMTPTLLWTKRLAAGSGYRGGVSNWAQIRSDLENLFRDSDAWITTLLDFYGLPTDVPGYSVAHDLSDPRQKAMALQHHMAQELDHSRFIPFLALHEFEAWLFCAPDIVAEHFDRPGLAAEVQQVVNTAGGPELINHGSQTHPKKRLQNMETGYKEASDGPTLAGKIGIPAIRTACPHFDEWLTKLEGLAVSP